MSESIRPDSDSEAYSEIPSDPIVERQVWLMDALLQTALQSDGANFERQRITKTLVMIREEEESLRPMRARNPRTSASIPAISAFLAVASIFIVLFVLNQGTDPMRAASAVIDRSLLVANDDAIRQYRLTVNRRNPLVGSQTVVSDLYVQGNDRFALCRHSPLGAADFWLGKDGELAWVAPPIGPVLVGGQRNLANWLDSIHDLDTPYLQVTSLLERMKHAYNLTLLENEELPIAPGKSQSANCRHIRGALRDRSGNRSGMRNLPDSLELWAETTKGMAIRITATWNEQSSPFGPKEISLELADVLPKDDAWFRHESRTPNRLVLGFGEAESVESIP